MSAEPVVRLHPLRYLPDGADVVIGRVDADSYGVFPPDGAALVRRLADGRPPAEAQRWYEAEYGEPVDMAAFLATLRELDFVAPVVPPSARPRPLRGQRLGAALFSAPAWLCYAALVAGAAVIAASDDRFRPWRPLNVFYTDYLVLIELTLFCVQPLLMLVHESFHALAGRRRGLPSRTRVARRFYFLGFETSLDGLVVLPRRQRYLPMLAGMLADLLVMCALTVLAWALTPAGAAPGLGARLCLAVAFTALPRLLFQCYFFLRTDVYYLIVTALGCHDLQTTTRDLLRNAWWRTLRRPARAVDPRRWHPRDARVARWYAPAHAAGYLVMIGVFVFVTVPIGWRFCERAAHALAEPASADRFWDAVLLTALAGGQFLLAGILGLRDRRRAREAAPSRSTD